MKRVYHSSEIDCLGSIHLPKSLQDRCTNQSRGRMAGNRTETSVCQRLPEHLTFHNMINYEKWKIKFKFLSLRSY